jgi:biopolymer transport protein ExbD
MFVNDREADDALHADINVTPLVDVMLVLLVIFMVVTPLIHEQLPIDLPSTRTSTAAAPDEQVHLTAAADGRLRLNDEPVDRADLERALQQLYAARSERTIFLEADRSLSYAAVVDLMDACRAAGIERIGIITRKADTTGASPAA